jgi:hypothetical protein
LPLFALVRQTVRLFSIFVIPVSVALANPDQEMIGWAEIESKDCFDSTRLCNRTKRSCMERKVEMTKLSENIKSELQDVARTDMERLQKFWVKYFTQSPPDLDKETIRQILHLHLLELFHAHLGAETTKELDLLLDQHNCGPKPSRAGFDDNGLLKFRHDNEEYEILCMRRGYFCLGRYWTTLGALATHIAGTPQSGQEFFKIRGV